MSIKREILVYLHKFWNAKIMYNMKSILHEYSGIGVKNEQKIDIEFSLVYKLSSWTARAVL